MNADPQLKVQPGATSPAPGVRSPSVQPPAQDAERELLRQVEVKLGRPLTVNERAVLLAPPKHYVISDKLEMPEVARQLYDLYSSFLAKLTLGRPIVTPSDPHKPGWELKPWQFWMQRIVSVLLVGLPIGLGFAIYDQWQWSVEFSQQYPNYPPTLPVPFLSLLVGTILLPPLIWQFTNAQRACAKLADSDILDRLVGGDESLDAIFEHTPLPWRWICMGGQRRDLRGRAMLLAHYLDWFLGPPRTHFRWYWAHIAFVAAVTPLLVLLEGTQHPSTGGALFGKISAALSALQPLALALALILTPKAMFCMELLRQLRRRFGVLPPTPEETARHAQQLAAKMQRHQRQSSRQAWRKAMGNEPEP